MKQKKNNAFFQFSENNTLWKIVIYIHLGGLSNIMTDIMFLISHQNLRKSLFHAYSTDGLHNFVHQIFLFEITLVPSVYFIDTVRFIQWNSYKRIASERCYNNWVKIQYYLPSIIQIQSLRERYNRWHLENVISRKYFMIRSIALKVDENGIKVAIPKAVSNSFVDVNHNIVLRTNQSPS